MMTNNTPAPSLPSSSTVESAPTCCRHCGGAVPLEETVAMKFGADGKIRVACVDCNNRRRDARRPRGGR